MKFLVLITFQGTSLALQAPLEYHYQYEAQLTTCNPNIKTRFSGLGIKAKLIIQMKTSQHAIAKLTDIEVGTCNGCVQSSNAKSLDSIQYSTISQHAQELQEPFAMHFAERSGNVMIVRQQEEEWITNIKKGIVGNFLLEPVTSNYMATNSESFHSRRSFTTKEETIFGRCDSKYSISPILDMTPKSQMENLSQDVQEPESSPVRKSSVPELSGKSWLIIKTLNFDKCNDNVALEHIEHNPKERSEDGQHKAAQSRSSVGTFFMKGEPGAFRIEKAIVEGRFIKIPFGFQSEEIHAFINQKLVLIAVKIQSIPLVLPKPVKEIPTWKFQVLPPPALHKDQTSKPCIVRNFKDEKYFPASLNLFLLGKHLTPKKIQSMKREFINLLEDASNKNLNPLSSDSSSLPDSGDSNVVIDLNLAQEMIQIFPLSVIEEIFQEIFHQNDELSQAKQNMLLDVSVASGSATPMKAILERIKSGQISLQRATAIFMTLSSHFSSPIIFPELLKFVKNLNISSYEGPQILINFARVVHKRCMNHRAFKINLSSPKFDCYICKPSFIEEFLSFMKQKLKDSFKASERLPLVHALAYLGSEETLQMLRPIVLGKIYSTEKNVRSAAICALQKYKMPSSLTQQSIEILMAVIENSNQNPELRQTAVVSLVSWELQTAIWEKLANLTWEEKSQKVATFIASTIQRVASSRSPNLKEQSTIAANILPRVKPFPSSLNSFFANFLQYEKLGTNIHINWAELNESKIPGKLLALVKSNFGGIFQSWADVLINADGLDKGVKELILNLTSFNRANIPKNRSSKAKHSPSNKEDSTQPQVEPEFSILSSFLDSTVHYMVLDSETISKVDGKSSQEFLNKLAKGITFRLTKYLNPIQNFIFLPTELGLPLVASQSFPMVIQWEGEIQLKAPGSSELTLKELLSAKRVLLFFKSFYRFSSKFYVNLKSIAPWSEEVVSSEIGNTRQLNLPIYGKLLLTHEPKIKNLTLNLALQERNEFPVFYADNIPFTAVTPIWKVPSQENMKLVLDKPFESLELQTLNMTEIDLQYQGDVQLPALSYLILEISRAENFGEVLFAPTRRF